MSWFKKLAAHARAENKKDLECYEREQERKAAKQDRAERHLEYLNSRECCENCLYFEMAFYGFDGYCPTCSYHEIRFAPGFDPDTKTCVDFCNKYQ